MVDTSAALKSLVNTLMSPNKSCGSIYMDLEGVNLSISRRQWLPSWPPRTSGNWQVPEPFIQGSQKCLSSSSRTSLSVGTTHYCRSTLFDIDGRVLQAENGSCSGQGDEDVTRVLCNVS
jgi:hypothetical protein